MSHPSGPRKARLFGEWSLIAPSVPAAAERHELMEVLAW